LLAATVRRLRGPRALLAATALAVLIGIFFRVHAIDRKVYGFDETATALRVAGATLPDYRRALATGELTSLAAVRQRYQLAQQGSSPSTTVRALAKDDPQHAPLYYVLERAWQGFGTTILAWRTLAVVFGIVLLPAVWWLAAEAFDRETALVAVALAAISPFHVLFSQYNREYALWAVLTAVASALMFVALRRGGALPWAGYAVALVLGLYTHPFFFYVLAGHGVYVAIVISRDTHAKSRSFALAAAAALVAYAPWLEVMKREWHVIATTTQWLATPLPFKLLVSKWIFEIASVFFDAEYGAVKLAPLVAVVLLLVAAAAVTGARGARRERVLFVALLIAASALPLVAGDLAFHESRSTAARYLTPVWLGLELLVAAGLIAWMRSTRALIRAFGLTAFVALLAGGGFSLAVSGASTVWWIDSHDGPLVGIARQLTQRPGATLCYVDDYEAVLVLSDAVAVPVRLGHVPFAGCFALATKRAIAAVAHRNGSFVAVPPPVSDALGTELKSIHARTSRAHGFAFEELQLWRLDGGQLPARGR